MVTGSMNLASRMNRNVSVADYASKSVLILMMTCRLKTDASRVMEHEARMRRLASKVLMPVFFMVAAALPVPIILKFEVWPANDFTSFMLTVTTAIAVSILSAWYIVMRKRERSVIVSMIQKRISNKTSK